MSRTYLKKGIGLFALVLATSLILSACQAKTTQPTVTPGVEKTSAPGADTSMPAEKETVKTNQITIQNMAFGPTALTVKAGSTITVTNMDSPGHSVTSDDGTSFDTDIVSKGKTVTFVAPTKPGTYTYHCTPHPMMKGTLIVE